MRRNVWRILFLITLVFSVAVLVSACGGGRSEVELKLAPVSQLSPEVARAPVQVREAYQFAIANQEYLANFPCYCGCGAVGHESNLECYVREVRQDGTIVFDNHAFG